MYRSDQTGGLTRNIVWSSFADENREIVSKTFSAPVSGNPRRESFFAIPCLLGAPVFIALSLGLLIMPSGCVPLGPAGLRKYSIVVVMERDNAQGEPV